jgi:hypothetical protein
MPTIISSVPTAEGFVIGSDGRCRGSDGEILREDAQKVYPLERPGISLAYGIFGTVRIGTDATNVLFDFEREIPNAVQRIGVPKNWWDFLSLLTKELTESLNRARAGHASELDPERGTTITLGGYYGRFQKLGDIRFSNGEEHSKGEPRTYQPGFSFPWGSIKLFDLLNDGDPRVSNYAYPERYGLRTLQDGIQRVRNDILMHYDPELRKLDEVVCPGIGGRIQIATVTIAEGFRWVTGFECT